MVRTKQNEILAEESVLGSILIDSDCHADVFGSCRPEWFAEGFRRDAYSKARGMYMGGDAVDVVTLSAALHDDGQYFASVMQGTPTAANVMQYVGVLREAYATRLLLEMAESIEDGIASLDDVQTVVDGVRTNLEQISETTTEDSALDGSTTASRFMDWLNAQAEDPTHAFLTTGFGAIDKQLGGGFFRSGLYVIGGRPGMGKTTVAINIAERLATRGCHILFVSLEMSLEQITAKRVAAMTGIPYNAVYTSRLMDDEMRIVVQAIGGIANKQFETSESGIISAHDIDLYLAAHKDIDCVFVDYMGILEPSEDDRQKPRYEQMTNISKALKAIAKKNHIPVIALAQLNRESTKTANKRPSMSELRDSGAIEQDADGIILVHREGYYDPDADQTKIELNIAKNRHAETGTIYLTWRAESGTIQETTREEYA